MPAAALTEHLVAVAQEARNAPHGRKGEVYARAARTLGLSVATIKAQVGQINGRQRKRRCDAGAYTLSEDEARILSAYLMESYRANGKRLMSIGDAVEQLRTNGRLLAGQVDEETGEFFPLSDGAISRALRGYQRHPEQLLAPKPVTSLRSRHPNHVWQLDASLCVLYYLHRQPGDVSGLRVMKESEFNKNKPKNLKKVEKDRVWRYVITDHASGSLYVEYVLGAESTVNVLDVFIHAIQRRENEPFHGVPWRLMMDPGSANISKISQNLFRSLLIELDINQPGNPRAKGQVERTNDLVERKFESGLRMLAVNGLEHLNELVRQWAAWFNGTAIHTRHKQTRFAIWQRITEAQLRLAPDEQTCRELARSAPKPCTVDPNLQVRFLGHRYRVDRVPGVYVGGKLDICRNPFREGGAQAVVFDADGHETYHVLEIVRTDELGFDLSGAVIGEEHKARPKTAPEYHAEQAAQLAAGDMSPEERKKAKAPAFGGQINPYQAAQDYRAPDWMPKRGTDHPVAKVDVELPPLSITAACKRIKPAVEAAGREWGRQQYLWIKSRYPDGVPEDAIAELIAMLSGVGEEGAKAGPVLRVTR